ncbi:MAG: radical SAM protein [Actinobacteria bacterium]|nr:radical SAM protein [Actinomycetota bacterium]
MIEKVTAPYNEMKIFHHMQKLNDIKDGKVTGPIFLRIKPTNICQDNCYYCSYRCEDNKQQKIRFNSTDYIKWETLKQTIIEFKELGGKSVCYSGGGEPLLYYKIYNAVVLSKKLGLDVAMITNGQKLNGEIANILGNVNWVRISADSCNAEMFHKIRRVGKEKFTELENNIRNFAESKDKSCELGINCVVSKFNANHIYEIAEYMKNLGVNHIKFAALVNQNTEEYHKSFKSNVISQIEKATEDLTDSNFKVYDKYSSHFDFSAKHCRTYNNCILMQIGAIIGADSCIYLCHDKAYDTSGLLGNLKEKSFKEIWLSEDTKKFFNNFNPMEKCQHHCMYDSRNILLNNYLHVDKRDINFI